MNIIEVNDIKKYLKSSRYIGRGRTAKCYLLKDGSVLKYYLNTYKKNELFRFKKDMISHLSSISEIGNNTYCAPEKLMIKDDEVIGYIYPHIKSRTVQSLGLNTKIFDLLSNYDKLLTDTKEISDKYFRLGDVHSRNILFNGEFNVIDLDFGYFLEHTHITNLTLNMNSIMQVCMCKIVGVDRYADVFNFYSYELQEAYMNLDFSDSDKVNEFFELIAKKVNKSDPTIFDVRKKHLVEKADNSYYSFF